MKIPLLISYYVLMRSGKVLDYINKHPDRFRVIIDSGAYSARTLGVEITVEGYSEWIKAFKPRFQCDGVFQLDKIYDQTATRENFKLHEKLGVKTIPIFTYAETSDQITLLRDLVKRFPYVGCGGVRKKREYAHWLLQNCERPDRIHLFAYSDLNVLRCYKPKSCDHSTWLNGTKFGLIMTQDMHYWGKPRIDLATVRKLGFQEKDFDKLNDPEWRHTKNKYLGLSVPHATLCNAYLGQVKKLNDEGVTMYLVVSNAENTEVLDNCYQYFIEQKPIDLFKKD